MHGFQESTASLKQQIFQALEDVVDPEVGINIVELGLIYRVEVSKQTVLVEMTLTTPACPMGNQMIKEVRSALQALLEPEFTVDLKLVWEPPWSPEQMSDKAKQMLGWD